MIDGGFRVVSSWIVLLGNVASCAGVIPYWIWAPRVEVLLFETPTLIVPQLPGEPLLTG